jgi:hypothetical protein
LEGSQPIFYDAVSSAPVLAFFEYRRVEYVAIIYIAHIPGLIPLLGVGEYFAGVFVVDPGGRPFFLRSYFEPAGIPVEKFHRRDLWLWVKIIIPGPAKQAVYGYLLVENSNQLVCNNVQVLIL